MVRLTADQIQRELKAIDYFNAHFFENPYCDTYPERVGIVNRVIRKMELKSMLNVLSEKKDS